MKKTMKKGLSLVLAMLLLLGALSACQDNKTNQAPSNPPQNSENVQAPAAPAGDPITLIYADGCADDFPSVAAAKYFADELSKRTDGRITVSVNNNSVFGSESEMIEGVQLGTIDMVWTSITQMATTAPSVMLWDLPGLFSSQDHAHAAITGEVGKAVAEAVLAESNIRVLGFVESGFRNLCTMKPIQSVEELNGLKIRVMNSQVHLDAWTALGASPTVMSFNDALTTFQQGGIDAIEVTNPLIYSLGVSDVAKYYAETHHVYTVATFIFSQDRWASLSAEDQALISEVYAETEEMYTKLIREYDAEKVEVIKSKVDGSTVLDSEAIYEMCSDVYNNYPQFAEWVAAIKALNQ